VIGRAPDDPWTLLEEDLGPDVPAIVDAISLQWTLHGASAAARSSPTPRPFRARVWRATDSIPRATC
jgi:hypothetical protein